ncbi:helix-turn-helix transcriptional regulator [Oscillospiraceae bacterium CM]|nr:helix-turn-helix transcriptional regulator [Oscillospiraceae bacterium CM]
MGAVIQAARLAHGITQTALAERIDVSLRTVIAIETGKRNPTFEVLYKVIRELNIPADLIFRPDYVHGTPEQEQFIREFRDADEQEQRIAIASARSIWRELRHDEK